MAMTTARFHSATADWFLYQAAATRLDRMPSATMIASGPSGSAMPKNQPTPRMVAAWPPICAQRSLSSHEKLSRLRSGMVGNAPLNLPVMRRLTPAAWP